MPAEKMLLIVFAKRTRHFYTKSKNVACSCLTEVIARSDNHSRGSSPVCMYMKKRESDFWLRMSCTASIGGAVYFIFLISEAASKSNSVHSKRKQHSNYNCRDGRSCSSMFLTWHFFVDWAVTLAMTLFLMVIYFLFQEKFAPDEGQGVPRPTRSCCIQ